MLSASFHCVVAVAWTSFATNGLLSLESQSSQLEISSFLAEQTLHQYVSPTLALHWYLLSCHSLSHLSTTWDALFHTSTGFLSFPDLSPMQHGCHSMTHYLHSSHWNKSPFSTISWITGFIRPSCKRKHIIRKLKGIMNYWSRYDSSFDIPEKLFFRKFSFKEFQFSREYGYMYMYNPWIITPYNISQDGQIPYYTIQVVTQYSFEVTYMYMSNLIALSTKFALI